MNEINKVQDDEIDIFELFQILWDGKWLIIAFVVIAVLLGGGFLLLKDAVYETKLFLSVNTSIPFEEDNKNQRKELKPYVDFQKSFTQKNSFRIGKKVIAILHSHMKISVRQRFLMDLLYRRIKLIS